MTRKLSRKDGELLRSDLFTASKFRYRDLVTFFRGLRQDDLFTTQQSTKLILRRRLAFAGDHFVKAVSTFKYVCWHCF
jgi:hypothetical protein